MNRLDAGKVYTAARLRSGNSSNGPWELIVTQDERGNNEIAVFATNVPSGVAEGGKFRIEKIVTVSYGNRKDNNGNWRANISVNAELTPVQSYDEFSGGSPDGFASPAEEEGDLPF